MIVKALLELAPKGEWVMNGNAHLDNIEWLSEDVERPSNAAIIAKVRELHEERVANLYQEKRLREYPSTDELIVAMWESNVENRPEALLDLQEKRQAVKEKYPKP